MSWRSRYSTRARGYRRQDGFWVDRRSVPVGYDCRHSRGFGGSSGGRPQWEDRRQGSSGYDARHSRGFGGSFGGRPQWEDRRQGPAGYDARRSRGFGGSFGGGRGGGNRNLSFRSKSTSEDVRSQNRRPYEGRGRGGGLQMQKISGLESQLNNSRQSELIARNQLSEAQKSVNSLMAELEHVRSKQTVLARENGFLAGQLRVIRGDHQHHDRGNAEELLDTDVPNVPEFQENVEEEEEEEEESENEAPRPPYELRRLPGRKTL